MSIKGFSTKDKSLSKVSDISTDLTDARSEFVTVQGLGAERHGLDCVHYGVYLVAGTKTVAADSTSRLIKCVGHEALKDDIIIFSSGSLIGKHYQVQHVVSADEFVVTGNIPSSPIGLTFDVKRYLVPRFNADGSQIVTVVPAPTPIAIDVDGVTTNIKKDTLIPANSVPMPVELYGASGEINITAGDINVHTSHLGVNFDSTRIGDGTNLMAVNASLEALVKDTTSNTSLGSIDTKITACDTGAVTVASSVLPTGAATEVTLAALDAKVTAVNTGAVVVSSSALPTGAATEVTLAALDAKVTAVNTGAVVVSSSALPAGAATEVTLAAQSAKLPATLGQKIKAESLSVTIASDQESLGVLAEGKASVALAYNDYTSTAVTTAAYVELVASLGATVNELEIFDSSGEALILAVGAALSEVDQIYIVPGGNGKIPLQIASGARVSIKALTGNANLGFITINFLG